MEGSSRRRAALLRRLHRGMRLLLPDDPGPAAMLDAVRQVSPGAKRILPHRIQVDGRSQFYLSRAYPIDAGMRRQARLPQDVTVAYFLKWVADSEADAASYREQGAQLLAGLAARFGGICWPSQGGEAAGADSLSAPGEVGVVGETSDAGGAGGLSDAEETDGRDGDSGRAGAGRWALRVGLLFLCMLAFFGFAADDGTAAKWPLVAVNALTGLLFAAATVLMAWRRLGRR